MTKSTITDKRVTSVIERLEHYACNLKWTNVRGAQDLLAAADGLRELQERRKPLQDKDLQGVIDALEHPAGINAAGKQVVRHALVELQERRKVERGTEPYGFTDGDRRGMIYKPEHSDRLTEPVPLYRHAQPAPVVPELRVDWQENEFSAGWNACRAAMLAAAPQSPGSEPATVPGKWIPVSERMPESNGVYFGWDGKRVLEVNCFFGGFSANQFIHGEITHWMPLPAAPQEVNRG